MTQFSTKKTKYIYVTKKDLKKYMVVLVSMPGLFSAQINLLESRKVDHSLAQDKGGSSKCGFLNNR